MKTKNKQQTSIFSFIVSIFLVVSLLVMALYIYKYDKANTDNQALIETNAKLNEDLTIKDLQNKELKEQLKEQQGSTSAVKNYALENQLTFEHYFNFQSLTTEECEEITKAYYNLCKNNQPIYKGLVFTCINDEFPRPEYTNENGDIVYYYSDSYSNHPDDMIAPEGKNMFQYMSSTSNFSNILLLEDFNYEVGKSYELFEKPVYLDSLDFECYEIEGNTYRFRNAIGTPSDLLALSPGANLDIFYHFIEVEKEENRLVVYYNFVSDYDANGNPVFSGIVNFIELD